jgi:LysR family transcriptional regulator for metE and metH
VLPATTIETRDLRLVRAIAESGGVTRAGRALGLSQSAVSHQLKSLEERLGVHLFERRGRGVRMTDAGRRVLELSREVLEPMARVESELRGGARGGRTRTLRISSECHTAYAWLPRVLGELANRHPDVALRIVAQSTSDLADALADSAIDLALLIERPATKGHVSTPLFDDEIVAVLSPGHPLASKPFLQGRDLASEMLILPEVSRAVSDRVRRRLFPAGGTFRRSMRVPLTEAIVELVRARHGVSLLPAWSVSGPAARHEVVTVRLTQHGLWRTWYAARRRDSSLEDAIATLAELVRARSRA